MKIISNRKFILIFLFVFYILTGFLNICLAENDIVIIPQPKNLVSKNYEIYLANDWRIARGDYDKDSIFFINYLIQSFTNEFNLNLSVEKITLPLKEKRIILGTTRDGLINEILKKEKIEIPEVIGREGYLLEVFDNHIIIVANEPSGMFYGIQTFMQLIKAKNGQTIIPAVKILDYPSTKIRAVHFCGADLEKLDGLKRQLEYMVRLKLNAAIIDAGANYNLENGNNRSNLIDLCVFARQHNIEPIPELQSFGGSAYILLKDPHCAEGKWVQDERFKFKDNMAMPIIPFRKSLINVIRTNSADIMVKNLGKTKIYKENKDYKIILGQITAPYSKEIPTKVVRLSEGEIKDREEVLISYDQIIWQSSFAEWKIPYCPSEPRTYDVMFSAIKNVIGIMNPKYISIGHDEIRGMNKDSRCRKRNMSNAELLAEDVTKLSDFAKSLDPNVRLLMWDDMVNPWHNGNDENYQAKFGGLPGKTSPALELMPKDAIMMVWWYDPDDWLNKMKNSLDYFESKGLNYFVSCWKDKKNIKDWMKLINGRKDCLGIIVTTWDGFEKNLEGIRYTAQMAW